MSEFTLNASTKIIAASDITIPVKNIINIFQRDTKMVLKQSDESLSSSEIYIHGLDDSTFFRGKVETYHICFETDKYGNSVMHVHGSDELGLIYGILFLSEEFLGFHPFWYWLDKIPEQKNQIEIPAKEYNSTPKAYQYRGWFINDEVSLLAWEDKYPPGRNVWEPVFETILRCGGNMVIPGTDLPKEGIQWDLASEMGLWLTHHHAEPLGAEMFLRAFPYKNPSYIEQKHLFEQVWKEAIEKQKQKKVVWMLSFRGQGDEPFWHKDPGVNSDEKRGALISEVIQRQYDMIHEVQEHPVCCVALYSELSELYKAGHIKLPSDVIKVWADNGYGKMVSRRNGNENQRISSMPCPNEGNDQGLYYHVTFHDLQASNHLTMFGASPSLISDELKTAYDLGGKSYLLVNSGNIRMHTYTLDLVRKIWTWSDVNSNLHLQQYVHNIYHEKQHHIEKLYRRYFKSSISFGSHKDEKAGDEFYHHPVRQMIGHWMQHQSPKTVSSLVWAAGDIRFPGQVRWFKEKYTEGVEKWGELRKDALSLLYQLNDKDRRCFQDQFVFHLDQHYFGSLGARQFCEAFEEFERGNTARSFVRAFQAIKAYHNCLDSMRISEHGKWHHFYRGDWLTNVRQTIESLRALQKFVRMHGDSPDFFAWYKEFLMPATEKGIYLENTHRNPLPDDDLAKRLEDRFLMTSC